MIVFAQSEAERTARLLRNQGMEKRYHNELVGFNLRMTDIHAAIGIQQLKKLPNWTEKRKKNADFLSKNISSPLVLTPVVPEGYSHVFHQFTVRIKHHRDEISTELTESGIGNGVYYPTQVHKLPSFNSNIDLPITEMATKQVLSLPVHPSLKKKELNRIAKTLNEIAKKYEQKN
jgi:dTDP-4-amino-4,6-dideoxygalactose transaminase